MEALPAAGGCERQPAVLVPGFTGSKEDFIALLQTLAQAGRRVVAIDMPGQYESRGPEDPAAYTCAALGQTIDAVVTSVADGPVHLLGHSFGGLVTRETVLAGNAPLLSYTLMSSGPSAVEGSSALDAQQLVTALGEAPTSELLAQIWWRHMDAPARESGLPEDVYTFLRERMLANSPVGLARMAAELTSAADRTAELAAVELPMLVLYGENDNVWSPQVQDTMAKRLRAERVVVPGAAHSPNVEAPETTASALTKFFNAAEAPKRTG
ncbi:alpha/beta hydrolase [Salinactinospora qingdaonensis]|uniref:Alpha/beta hydrolase n=1 Tax=Salinactinospora qingdaonensis TaxID=702744 RepID=A0ABP7FLL4_9ACTN